MCAKDVLRYILIGQRDARLNFNQDSELETGKKQLGRTVEFIVRLYC